nr:hypothetical protein, T. brucei homolog Tb09.160.0350 [Trypanosoma congolense IL3000]
MSDRPDKRCKTAPLAIDPSSSKCDDHESFFSPPTADYVPLKTNATHDTNPDHFSDTTTQHRISANQAPDVAVVSENEFHAKVDAIRSGVIAGPLIAQQNLTFSVPRDGKLMELIPNGIYVKVTESNVSEFLRLLADKSAALSGRVRRLESIRRLEVAGVSLQELSRDKDKFSPTHFSKDIFAPYDARTCFLVDADASEEILPLYLREQEELQRKADTYYLRVIRQGDIKTWRTIFDHVQSDPSALKRYGVTFCVPSALSSRDGEGDRELNVHELITRGSNTPVEESQLWLFTKMVKQLLQPVV